MIVPKKQYNRLQTFAETHFKTYVREALSSILGPNYVFCSASGDLQGVKRPAIPNKVKFGILGKSTFIFFHILIQTNIFNILIAMYNQFSKKKSSMMELEPSIDNVIQRKCQTDGIELKVDNSTMKMVEMEFKNIRYKK